MLASVIIMNFVRRTFFGLPRQNVPDTTDSLQSMMFVDEQGEITWELCECAVSLPSKKLLIGPCIAAFSGKNSYKNSQFIPITLHNDSKHEWIVFKVQHYEPRDPFLSQEQLAKFEKACVPLMASPNVGLIGPGQEAVFKLILPARNIWPVSREATIGKMSYFRILQMQVTDPWEVLSAFSGNNTSLTRGIKQLFDALNTARSCEDALERIYSCDVPFFLPLCPIILSETNLNAGAKDKV
uniref:Uncharacterized protein n=3 Tax=Meloidogyne TaxID=189290 RepID=A0A6V7U7D0_MELEN|nr:unnamed protein product [Meloidogyne enterolobii]